MRRLNKFKTIRKKELFPTMGWSTHNLEGEGLNSTTPKFWTSQRVLANVCSYVTTPHWRYRALPHSNNFPSSPLQSYLPHSTFQATSDLLSLTKHFMLFHTILNDTLKIFHFIIVNCEYIKIQLILYVDLIFYDLAEPIYYFW